MIGPTRRSYSYGRPAKSIFSAWIKSVENHQSTPTLSKWVSHRSCYLAEKSGVGLEVKSNNVKFTESFQTTARRANVVVDHITIFTELKMGPDQVFSDIR
jgi:hypothetical protein